MRKTIAIGMATAMAASAIIATGITNGATAESCPTIADAVGGLLPQNDADGKVLNYTVLEYR